MRPYTRVSRSIPGYADARATGYRVAATLSVVRPPRQSAHDEPEPYLRCESAHDNHAHRSGVPSSSDEECDAFEEMHAPLLLDIGCLPTKALGFETSGRFRRVLHKVAVPSLSKLGSASVSEWAAQWKRMPSLRSSAPLQLVVEPTMDGLVRSLFYVVSKLLMVLSRESRKSGMDITCEAVVASAVPIEVESTEKEIEVGSELFLPIAAHLYVPDGSFGHGETTRRVCVSMIMNWQPQALSGCGARFLAYNVAWLPALGRRTIRFGALVLLMSIGFVVPDRWRIAKAVLAEEAIDMITVLLILFLSEIGLVVSMIGNLPLFRQMGATEHHPRGAVARKFACPIIPSWQNIR